MKGIQPWLLGDRMCTEGAESESQTPRFNPSSALAGPLQILNTPIFHKGPERLPVRAAVRKRGGQAPGRSSPTRRAEAGCSQPQEAG